MTSGSHPKPLRSRTAAIARLVLIAILLIPLYGLHSKGSQSKVYYPGKAENWEERGPESLGLDPSKLAEAVEFARTHVWDAPRDLKVSIQRSFSREPYGTIIGPVKERGEANGIILKGGYIVAEWGDTHRVDMTFSVTKSYLSTTAGLAMDAGLIRDLQDPVKLLVPDGTFDSEHNAKITWHHLLNQTSDWSGTLWEKPDWADGLHATSSGTISGTARSRNRARATNTTTSGSISWPTACSRSGEPLCPWCLKPGSWIPSTPHPPGAGTDTAIPGCRSTGSRCSR